MNKSTLQPLFDEESQREASADLLRTILTYIYILFAILGIIGNGLVLIVIAGIKDLQDVTNLLIANQSLIDFMSSVFLLGGFVIPLPVLPTDRPTLSRFICAFWNTKYPFWSTIVASCLNLVMMTTERYIAVIFPIRYRIHTISGKAVAVTLIPWMVGFLFETFTFYFTKVEDGKCLTLLWNAATRIGICVATYFLEFLLPVTTMIYVYTRILLELRRSTNRFSHSVNTSSVSAGTESKETGRIPVDFRSKARKNIIKTLATVSICFVICMSFNLHLFLANGFGVDVNYRGPVYITSVIIAFGNIWINPLIYTFQYERFQKGIKKLLCRTQSKPQVVSRL